MLESLLAMIMILSDNASNLFLSSHDATNFRKHTDELLLSYTELAKQADDERLLLWKVVPKHHWLWHLAQKAKHLCPRVSCCMLDEDYVGKQKLVVAACVQGTRLEDVPASVMIKNMWAMHFANETVG